MQKPMKSTDKRRRRHHAKEIDEPSSAGAGSPLADLFNDRRKPNGSGKRAIK